jgi:hypothetical protein
VIGMPQLDPDNTDAGAMERLMLLETYSGDQRAAAYSNFVQDAITAATEKLPALGAIDVTATGWRTAAHASPGMNFRVITTLQGNTVFATSPVPPMPRHKRHSRRK